MSLLNDALNDLEARAEGSGSKPPGGDKRKGREHSPRTTLFSVVLVGLAIWSGLWLWPNNVSKPGVIEPAITQISAPVEQVVRAPSTQDNRNEQVEAPLPDPKQGEETTLAVREQELTKKPKVTSADATGGQSDNKPIMANTQISQPVSKPETKLILQTPLQKPTLQKSTLQKSSLHKSMALASAEPDLISQSDSATKPKPTVKELPLDKSKKALSSKVTRPVAQTAAIQKSIVQRETELVQALQALALQNDFLAVETKAKVALTTEFQNSEKIAEQWLDVLIRQNKMNEANKLWTERSLLGEKHVFARAKIVAAQFGNPAAIAYLEQNIPLAEQELAMYGGLLQKQKQFSEAEATYAQLLKINRSNSIYWLGMGLSLDSQIKPQAALSAYQRAQTLGGHNRSVETFINNRIAALAQQTEFKTELSQW